LIADQLSSPLDRRTHSPRTGGCNRKSLSHFVLNRTILAPTLKNPLLEMNGHRQDEHAGGAMAEWVLLRRFCFSEGKSFQEIGATVFGASGNGGKETVPVRTGEIACKILCRRPAAE
jgi:hypothetical protein